jgi:hypothetical protein
VRTRLSRLLVVCTLGLILPGGRAFAQSEGAVPERGAELTVYLLTMGPGDAVWERFGHNALWIRDHLRGTDLAYNYGMFSFAQENFVMRFVRGHMDYWMESFDAALTVDAYVRADRSVWAQELNLSPAQRADLRDFLEWNERPENSVYRYDYYRDNCSTRVRDAIDRVVGGQLRSQTDRHPSGASYRDHTRRLTRDDPIIYTALMLALGQPVDREISVWEEMFLPMELRERIADVHVTSASGEPVPLVSREIELYRSSRPLEDAIPPPLTWAYLVVGGIGGGVIWSSARLARRSRAGGVVFGVAAGAWTLLAGLLGSVLLGLWAFTDHEAAYRNENLFFYTPLLLPLAALIPFSARAPRGSGGRSLLLALASAVALLSIVGLLLQPLRPFYQSNGELIALALPINLGILLAALELRGSSLPARFLASWRSGGA